MQDVSNKRMFAVIDRRFGQLEAIFSCLENAESWIEQLQNVLHDDPKHYYIGSSYINPDFQDYYKDL